MSSTTMRGILRASAALAVLALGAAACGDDDDGDAATTTTTTAGGSTTTTEAAGDGGCTPASPAAEVRQAGTFSLLGLPVFVADSEGFFEENGIELTITEVPGGPAAATALLAGDADVMINAPDSVLLAHEQGQPLKIIGALTVRGVNTILVQEDFPTPNLAAGYPEVMKDLEGSTVGVTQLGSAAENFFRLLATDAGMDPDADFTFVAVGLANTALPAFQQRQIDVWMGFEPGTSMALHQLGFAKSVVDFRDGEGPDALVDYSPNILATTQDFIDDQPEVVACYVDAVRQAQEWIQDPANRDALDDLVVDGLKLDAGLLPGLIDDNLEVFGTDVPVDNIQNAIDYLTEFGLLKNPVTYEDVVATEYVDG
ncbi:MAG: ABC transporter substrate-binding protein [Acidimicrobiia bacterium]